MKSSIAAFSRLADLRASQVRQVLRRVHYQQQLCQRYRDNLVALDRLCRFETTIATTVQRHNHQQYKATLHGMMTLQAADLAQAERGLASLREEMLQAMCSEKSVVQALAGKLQQWHTLLARQEQKLQDAMGAQAGWRRQLQA